MAKKNGVPARINIDLADLRREFAQKNNIDMTEADKEIAKIMKNMKGKIKSTKEIVF